MFNNIGRKIKLLAHTLFWISVLCVVVGAIYMIVNNLIDKALLYLALGVLISWISVFCLYGFGELIEKVSIIADNNSIQFIESNKENLQNKQLKQKVLDKNHELLSESYSENIEETDNES